MKTETLVILAVVALGGYYVFQQLRPAQGARPRAKDGLMENVGQILDQTGVGAWVTRLVGADVPAGAAK